MQATTHRLVFLTPLQQKATGFEIRSLQEFMAADALMDGSDDEVERRLEAIVVVPYWRNVFLFAAGKCFADQRWRRPMILSLCRQLNLSSDDADSSDPLAAATLAGSRLALDILEEELARDRFQHQLIETALDLLKIPDEAANVRLASLYEEKRAGLFRERIEAQLTQPDFSARTGSWIVLKILCARNVAWAKQVAGHFWPAQPYEGLQILGLHGSRIPSEWAATKLPDE